MDTEENDEDLNQNPQGSQLVKKGTDAVANKAKNAATDAGKNLARKAIGGQAGVKGQVKRKILTAMFPFPGIYIIIAIVAIIVIVGIVMFFVSVPAMFVGKLKEIVKTVARAVAAYFGADTTEMVDDEEIYQALDYLKESGYSLKGDGFLTDYYDENHMNVSGDDNSEKWQKATEEQDINNLYYDSSDGGGIWRSSEDDTIAVADSDFVFEYIVSDNYCYTLANHNIVTGSNDIGGVFGALADLFSAIGTGIMKFGNFLFGPVFDALGISDAAVDTWGSGLIAIYHDTGEVGICDGIVNDESIWSDASIAIDADSETMTFKRETFLNSNREIEYSLDGWTGRYGMPLEFLVAVHKATGMPDLAYDMATSFNTRVNIYLHGNDSGNVGASIKTDSGHVSCKEANSLVQQLQEGVSEAGEKLVELGLYIKDGESYKAKDNVTEAITLGLINNDEDYLCYIPYIAYVSNHWYRDVYFVSQDKDGNKVNPGSFVDIDYNYQDLTSERWTVYKTDDNDNFIWYVLDETGNYTKSTPTMGDGKNLKTDSNGYYYYDGTRDEAIKSGYAVTKMAVTLGDSDTDLDVLLEDLGWEESSEDSGNWTAYHLKSSESQGDYQPLIDEGEEGSDSAAAQMLEVQVNISGSVNQKGEGQRLQTNAEIKKMFLENTYFKYDGSEVTAEAITRLRKKNEDALKEAHSDENKSMYGPVAEVVNGVDENYLTDTEFTFDYNGTTYKVTGDSDAEATGDEELIKVDDLIGKVELNSESLSAFSILENMHTLDADYIYRDFKELIVELGFFTKEELTQDIEEVMEFPIPELCMDEEGNGNKSGSGSGTNQQQSDILSAATTVLTKMAEEADASKWEHGAGHRTLEEGLKDRSATCVSLTAWILQEAGYLKEGTWIEHDSVSKAKEDCEANGIDLEAIDVADKKVSELESSGDIQAGDVLLWRSGSNYTIGIYGGNNTFIHNNDEGPLRDLIRAKGPTSNNVGSKWDVCLIIRPKNAISNSSSSKSKSGTATEEIVFDYPNTSIDKNENEMGTMIHSKRDIDANTGITARQLAMEIGEEEEDIERVKVESDEALLDSSEKDEINTSQMMVANNGLSDTIYTNAMISVGDAEADFPASDGSVDVKDVSIDEFLEKTRAMCELINQCGYDYCTGDERCDHVVWGNGCGLQTTFAASQKNPHANYNMCCGTLVSWALQNVGVLADSAHDDSAAGLASWIQENLDCEVITDGSCEPGDIFCYNHHIDICGEESDNGGYIKYNGGHYVQKNAQPEGSNSSIEHIDGCPNSDRYLYSLRINWAGSKKSGGAYEGFKGNEAVVSPVTGELVDYGVYNDEADPVSGIINRKNVDYVITTNDDGTREFKTGTEAIEEMDTEGTYVHDKVGYAIIKVLDAESLRKFAATCGAGCTINGFDFSKILSTQTNSAGEMNVICNEYYDGCSTEKEVKERTKELSKSDYSEVAESIYGYKEFYERYEAGGIAGYTVLVDGFCPELPDEDFDVDEDYETRFPNDQEGRDASEYQLSKESYKNITFSDGKINETNCLLTSEYKVEDDNKMDSKTATAIAKNEHSFMSNSPVSVYYGNTILIKEGTVLGRTYTDREFIEKIRTQESYEELRPSEQEDYEPEYDEETGELKNPDKVIGNYIRVKMTTTDSEEVEDVYNYYKLEFGSVKNVALDQEKFLFYMGVLLEGGFGSPQKRSDGWYVKGNHDGVGSSGNTYAFGLTDYNMELYHQAGGHADSAWAANDYIKLEDLANTYLLVIQQGINYCLNLKQLEGIEDDPGFLQGFISLYHNFGGYGNSGWGLDFKLRADEYASRGTVSKETWSAKYGLDHSAAPDYVEPMKKRRLNEYAICTKGIYPVPYSDDNDTEYDWESYQNSEFSGVTFQISEETPFTDWCNALGIKIKVTVDWSGTEDSTDD